MSDTNTMTLRDPRLARYSGLNRQLARRRGAADLVSSALREIYLRVEQFETGAAPKPKARLFRIAHDIAGGRQRADNRRLTPNEVAGLLDVPDARPEAGRVIEDRSEVDLLGHAIAELPKRRQRVLLLSRIEGLPHREIAGRLGITVRTVETDLKHAVEHCAERLQRPAAARSAPHRS